MVNKKDFAIRLQKMMDYYELSAASLADTIGIQRSSISHLLSGRNNPSLDFVLKILDNYPNISFNWFVKGLGTLESTFKLTDENSVTPTLFDEIKVTSNENATNKESAIHSSSPTNASTKVIQKIVLFYTDNTFKIYTP